MSTPNFYNRNASKIFSSECAEDWDVDDLIDDVKCGLKNATEVDRWENNGLRSYGGKIFAEINKTMGKWAITINIIMRDGYYGGVNLDWSVEIKDLTEGDNFERGEGKISNTAESYIDNQIAKIEKVFTDYTTPLICLGVFSNGEAVYEKANR